MKFLTENIKAILSIVVVGCAFAYFFVCHFTQLNSDPQIIIAIVSVLGQVLSYYFGNSSGSAKKDQIIQETLNK